MDDEHSSHAHSHLRHLVMMRVEHLSAVLPQGELIFNGFSSFDVWLGEPTDAVHAIGKIKPMPVNGCGYSQPIRYIDSHPLAFDGLDRGAVHTAVESPTLGAQTRIEVMIDLFCDEMKNFNAINDFKRYSAAVRNYYRSITSPWQDRREWRYVNRSSAITFFPVWTAITLRWILALQRIISST